MNESADEFITDIIEREERNRQVLPNVAISVVCHTAFNRYFQGLRVETAVSLNLTCGESERHPKIVTKSLEI